MKVLLIVILLVSSVASNAQKIIKVKINNRNYKTVTQSHSSAPFLNVSLHKMENARSFSLEILNEPAIDAYKTAIEIQDILANTLMISSSDKNNKRSYVFDTTKLRSAVSKNRKLIFYETYEPANPMMRIRSKRTLLLSIHIN